MDNITKELVQMIYKYYTEKETLHTSDGYGYLLDIIEALKGHSEYLSTIYYHCPYFADLPSVVDMTLELVIEVTHRMCAIIKEGGELREEY